MFEDIHYHYTDEEYDHFNEETASFMRRFLNQPRSFALQAKSEMANKDKIVIHYGEGMEQAEDLAVALREKGIPSLAMHNGGEDTAEIFYGGGRLQFVVGPDGLNFLLNQYR